MIQYIIAASVIAILIFGGYVIHKHYNIDNPDQPLLENIMSKPKGYKTSLHMAIGEKSTSQITDMLAIGGNPNAQDEHGQTPLHYAAFLNRLDVTILLLANGANPNIEDNLGWRPLDMVAEIPENEDILDLLEEITQERKPSTMLDEDEEEE